MDLLLNKDVEIKVSYTSSSFGKIVLNLETKYAKDLIEALLEEVGIETFLESFNEDDLEEIKTFIEERSEYDS